MPTAEDPRSPRIPEMVGATSEPFELSEATSEIAFAIHTPTGPALLREDGMPRRVFLNVENITANARLPAHDVYLNLPRGAGPEMHPDRRVGTLAMFGLVEASRADEREAGNGLTYKLEATPVFLRLTATGDWDASRLRVSLVPRPWPGPARARVGRVSLYFE